MVVKINTASQTSSLTIEELRTLEIALQEGAEIEEVVSYFEIIKRHSEIYDAVIHHRAEIDSFSQEQQVCKSIVRHALTGFMCIQRY